MAFKLRVQQARGGPPLLPEEWELGHMTARGDGRGWAWLLEINFAGHWLRWTHAHLEITDRTGEAVTFVPGFFSFEHERSADPTSTTLQLLSFGVDELFFPDDLNVPRLIEQGHTLDRAKVIVSLWVSGRTYEERHWIVEGRAVDPTYDANNEVSFTIEADIYDDTGKVIAETMRVAPETWPDADEAAVNRYYPLVFGNPGPGVYTEADGTTGNTTGSPGLYVDTVNKLLLIAGHKVNAEKVRVINLDQERADDFRVAYPSDGLGQQVSVVDLSTTAWTGFAVEGEEYWVRWDHFDFEDNGALVDTTGPPRTINNGDPIVGAGHLIEYVLRNTSILIDMGRWIAAELYLNRFRLAGYVDEEVPVWEWLEDNIFPLLGISIGYSPHGIFPIVWHLDGDPENITQELVYRAPFETSDIQPSEIGNLLERLGPIEYDQGASAVRNEIGLTYARWADGDEFRRVKWLVGTDEPESEDERPNTWARISRQRYGRQPESSPEETDLVYDEATAQMILERRMRLHAFPRRIVSYEADPRLLGHLEPGQAVLLTDAEMAWDRRYALVRGITMYDGNGMQVELIIPEYPTRDRVPTGS